MPNSSNISEYFVSGFAVLLPTLKKELSIPAAAAVWPSAAFALVTSAFLLPCGRLADMFGGYVVYNFGLAWFCVWSLIAGFSKNELMLDWCRAMQGLGPAAFLSSGIQLLGSAYRPGPRKNLVFSLYGAVAPLGFFFGVFIAGLTGSFLQFGWYFWIGAIFVFSTLLASIYGVPNDRHVQRQVTMDWLGSALLISGLVLTVFALTDGSHAPNKWATPYIDVTLAVGISALGAFVYVEGWVASNPLVPFNLFKVPYIKPLFVGLFFNYGCLGIFLLYGTMYMTDIMGATPIQISAWFAPMCIGGVLLAVVGGYVLHLLPGTLLIQISSCGWILSALMFALAPVGANYWAFAFPAMIGATIGIDITFNVASVFITTSLSARRQGLAGALINTLLYLGIAIHLAFADITQIETLNKGLLFSYRAVFWYMMACSGASMLIMIFFVRIPKAESDLTADEREALLDPGRTDAIELTERISRRTQ